MLVTREVNKAFRASISCNAPPIPEVKVLVSSCQDLTFEVNEKACASQSVTPDFSQARTVPRRVSFLSLGIPVHKELRPSTISLHSSRASLSEQLDESRCARRLRMAANGEDSEACGISRTRRDRISPIRQSVSTNGRGRESTLVKYLRMALLVRE